MGYRLTQRKGRAVQVSFDGGPWKSTGCWTKDEAIRKIESTGIGDCRILFGDYAKEFYSRTDEGSIRYRDEIKQRKRSESLYYQRQICLDTYIMPRFANERIDKITSLEIDNWFVGVKAKRTGKLLRNTSRNLLLHILSEIFRKAVLEGVIKRNPVSDVQRMSSRCRSRRPYTDDEIDMMFPSDDERLIAVWGGLMWALFFCIMVDTGFRPGEIGGLGRDCYIEKYHAIFTRQSFNQFLNRVNDRIKTSDSGKDYKIGFISEQTERLLRRHLDETESKLLFHSSAGEGVSSSTSLKKFYAVAHCLGIETDGRPQYSLRHTFMTRMAGKYDESVVKELMGHTVWESVYDHRTPEMIARQVTEQIMKCR